ncbi:alpha/beta fold hydrolase [Marinicella sp. S1101]|uniref:esterase/lipase family protein n=1 Tax=Marinicella marina TaxID=2996016 RepID=UPI002260E1E8|nr:alpha/beta fold hydrolase [Marinicella marina]MCX7553297.1 alpha/beta fold hydrolase [Marinicella marina]MDJ1139029.1 alpha/beta fold hydrolase [Marinicella marina]
MSTTADTAVVLVHGLFMKRWTWSSYRRRLEGSGFKTYTFAYKTTRQSIDLSALQLAAFVNSRPETTVHLVVHSMGGILTMRALPKINKPGKLLMLGSPIKGSRVAHKLKRMGWHNGILKHATEPLTSGVVAPTVFRTTMMIAGTSPYGMGRVIEKKLGPSDGTVAIDETQADWLDYHEEIDANHFGLLNNKSAIEKTIAFFKQD